MTEHVIVALLTIALLVALNEIRRLNWAGREACRQIIDLEDRLVAALARRAPYDLPPLKRPAWMQPPNPDRP